MNDLPNTTDPQGQTVPAVPPPSNVTATPSGSKEVVGGTDQSEGLRDATGQELELPKEVAAAGVRIQPTSVPIPPAVANMGVKPSGNNIPVQTVSAVTLPITDDQIAAGLHVSLVNSLRWLSEWCVKRLKQLRVAVSSIGGKNVRVKI